MWFLGAKSDFYVKIVKFSPRIGNEENRSQKTKETITFIRVGAMGAKMSFLAPKVRNFAYFPILGAKMELFQFN